MNHELGELFFLQQLAPRYGVPVPEHLAWPADRKAVQDCMARWKLAIAKPDVLSGGRGKAGLVEEVDSVSDAIRALSRLSAAEHRGRLARTAYLVQHVPARYEVYSAITYDSRWLSPAITLSFCGGTEVEAVPESQKRTFPVDVYQGLDAYQAGELLESLGCPRAVISPLARALVNLWDMFITSGMKMCEVNPWRITPEGRPVACDFKGVFDEANFKHRNLEFELPEYPESVSEFQEEMDRWDAQSYQGQAHVSDLGGSGVLPLLFGGGASTIIVETLMLSGGDPMFLSDFGGNPPYERMRGTAAICFQHKLADAKVLLVLGGKANNTRIDVTFQAIADALAQHAALRTVDLPVIVGRGGPRLVQGFVALQRCLEELHWPYTIFGHDTPITMVAEYAGRLCEYVAGQGGQPHSRSDASPPGPKPETVPAPERRVS